MRKFYYASRYRSFSTQEEDVRKCLPYNTYQEALRHGKAFSIPEDAVEVWYSDNGINFYRCDAMNYVEERLGTEVQNEQNN